MKIMKDEWFPFVTKNIKAKYGWETFYYGGPGGGGRRGGGAAGGGAPGAGRGAGGGAAAGGAVTGAVPTPEVVGAQPQPGQMRAWNTFEHVPRYHNNYVGMRNRFALLSEAYAYATFEDRIKATNCYFVEEALNFGTRTRIASEGCRGGGQRNRSSARPKAHGRSSSEAASSPC